MKRYLIANLNLLLYLIKRGGGRKIEQAQFERGTVANVIRQNKSNNSIKSKNNQDNHFAVFPNQIPDKLINYLSKEGDLIYEPFIGSGTTALTCIKYNRNYIGSELVKEYFDIAEQRINASVRQTKMFY